MGEWFRTGCCLRKGYYRKMLSLNLTEKQALLLISVLEYAKLIEYKDYFNLNHIPENDIAEKTKEELDEIKQLIEARILTV